MVVDRFPHEPFLARQVDGLLRRGLDLHILCQIHDRDSPAWSVLNRSALSGRIHPWPERTQTARLAGSMTSALARAATRRPRELARAIRREFAPGLVDRRQAHGRPLGRLVFDARVLAVRADIVHFQFGDLARRRLHVAQAVDCGFSTSFRGYDLAYAGIDEPGYYDALWPSLDGAHTLGQDLMALAIARGCPPGVEWTVIPPAVDPDVFKPNDHNRRQRPELEIVSVGRLHWKKGYTDALWAVAGLRAAGVEFRYRIIGSGGDDEELRWHIKDLGLDTVVELVGPTNPDRIPIELARADVFLHPALTEGFGNAVLEAQSAGLAVVCTDAEGLAENVVDGVTGFVVPRRRPAELQERLMILAGDDALRLKMGRAGRQRVLDHFSPEQQLDRYLRFFDQVARRDRRRIGRS